MTPPCSRNRASTPLADGAVHVWLLRHAPGSDDVARVLARYAGNADDGPSVVRGAGKPRLDTCFAGVRFNVAHAGGLLLVAVACGREVGVDVEPLDRGPWPSLPPHVLTASELCSLDGLAGQARNAAFLRLWTRKEAVLKAAGVGLAVEPRLIAVSGPAEPPEILSVPASIGTAARFGLVDLPLPGFAASVAVERPHGPVVLLGEAAPRAHEILTAARSAAYDSAVASGS